MDKFTKTTEIDISAMNSMEEEAPKSSKVGKVIAIIVSFLIAVAIWLYVIETDPTKYDKTYENIPINIVNISQELSGCNIEVGDVTVILTGTKSALADIDESDIIVDLNAQDISGVGTHTVYVKARVNDDISVEAKVKDSGRVEVVVTEK